MAENVVDALIVTLGLDSSDYQQGMEDAERSTREFSEKAPREAERGLNAIEAKFGATFRGIFHTFIAPLTAALGTMGIFSSYTQTADRIGKTAARIGASAEDLQAFGEAAKRAGGSVEGFMGAFESLNGQLQRMQAMGGKGRIAPILKQLGISATEHGQVKDTFQILRELASASERLGKQKFAGLARFLGLDQGTIMLLQSGRVAMDELIARQKALGVYTKEDFEITQKFNDAISDLQQVFRSLAAVILRVIVPPIRMIAEAMTAVIKTFREHQGFIVAGLLTIAATMSGPLLKAVTSLAVAMKPLLVPIAAFAALGLIFDEIITYANGGKTALEGFWASLGTPQDYKNFGKEILEIGKNLLDAFSPLADAVKPLVSAFGSVVSAALKLIGYFVDLGGELARLIVPLDLLFEPSEPGGGWDTLKSVIKWVSLGLQSLSYIIEQVADWLGEMMDKARSALKSFEFVKTLRVWFKELSDWISGLFSPGQPGSEWSVLQSIIDGIKTGIDLMIGAVKSLFSWVEKVLDGIRSFFGGGESEKVAREQILAGRDEKTVIAEKASTLKQKNPALSDKEAEKIAKAQFSSEVAARAADNDMKQIGNDLAAVDPFAAASLGFVPITQTVAEKKPDTYGMKQNVDARSNTQIDKSVEMSVGSITVNGVDTNRLPEISGGITNGIKGQLFGLAAADASQQ